MVNTVNAVPCILPSAMIPLVDDNGQMRMEWYQYFLGLWVRSGQESGNTPAMKLAKSASDSAATAHAVALSAESTAANADANASIAIVQTDDVGVRTSVVEGAIATDLVWKAANLSDVASAPASRTNLGISGWALPLTMAVPLAGAVYVPLARPMVLPANLDGTRYYAATPPSGSPVFQVKCIRGDGTVISIGTMTLTAGSRTAYTASTLITQFNAGDVFQLVIPSTDAANIGFNFAFTLV